MVLSTLLALPHRGSASLSYRLHPEFESDRVARVEEYMRGIATGNVAGVCNRVPRHRTPYPYSRQATGHVAPVSRIVLVLGGLTHPVAALAWGKGDAR